MSETEFDIFKHAEFAKALGARDSVYVGKLTVLAAVTGSAARIDRQAKEAIKAEPNTFLRGASQLRSFLEVNPDTSDDYVEEVLGATTELERLNSQIEQGGSPYDACTELFDLYFRLRPNLAETIPGHIVECVCVDLIVQHDLDTDRARALFDGVFEHREGQTQ